MLDVKQLLAECEERMEMSVMHLEETLSHIRAGKANVHILDQVLWRAPNAKILINSPAAQLLKYAQQQFPAIHPGGAVGAPGAEGGARSGGWWGLSASPGGSHYPTALPPEELATWRLYGAMPHWPKIY